MIYLCEVRKLFGARLAKYRSCTRSGVDVMVRSRATGLSMVEVGIHATDIPCN